MSIPIKYTPTVHRIGSATITRVDETTFGFAPDVLFPDWDERHSHALNACFATTSTSIDLANKRVSLQTHLWVVEIDGLTIIVDTGIGKRIYGLFRGVEGTYRP